MVDLIAEFVEMDLNNQKLLKEKAKYIKIYTVHGDGRYSLMGRYLKKGQTVSDTVGKLYKIHWGNGSYSHDMTPKEFNESVIGSEEYEKYFRNFPKELIGG